MIDKIKIGLRATLNQFTPIANHEFEDSFKLFQCKEIDKGDHFVKSGETCGHIAFIVQGILRTYYINDKGDEITLCFCAESRFTTSFKSFISRQPSALDIQAIEPVKIMTLAYADLQQLYHESKSWQTLGRLLAEQEYLNMENYAVTLNRETAKEKYLRMLKEYPDIINRAPVQQIASYLGVTRETLSRIRKQISETDFVTFVK